LPDYLVGTGGWAYFKVPNKPSLKAYSETFNFVEVNYTFYEYPDLRTVEKWRRTVPRNFTFAVRCHQDLTHRIGLKPVDEAYYVFGRMISYCRVLEAPFLVLETPPSNVLNSREVADAKNFFSSANAKSARVVWEIRSLVTPEVIDLMREFDIVHCVDLSKEEPSFKSDIVYARLFGKGKHNVYQFTDEELVEIDRKAENGSPRVVAMAYHGVRMNSDAARFVQYKKTGTFFPVTSFTGVDSAKAVLSEDAHFPASKSKLIEQQGWKVIDLTLDKRVHLSELLCKIPDRVYGNLDEVVHVLGAVL
jgi:uncharacterized protein YecE (DUF72 family)